MAPAICLKIGELTSRVFEQSTVGLAELRKSVRGPRPAAEGINDKKSFGPAIKKPFDLFFSSLQCDPLAKKLSEGIGQERLLLTLTTADFLCSPAADCTRRH
jgi:hypothetical protein